MQSAKRISESFSQGKLFRKRLNYFCFFFRGNTGTKRAWSDKTKNSSDNGKRAILDVATLIITVTFLKSAYIRRFPPQIVFPINPKMNKIKEQNGNEN